MIDLTRREFLASLSAAGLTTLAGGAPRLLAAPDAPKATADTCILLWMAGGMAAPDTFDPKRYTPFEVGTPVEKILCTFPSIPTAVDNIKISQGLEHTAKILDRGTLIRSHVVADLGNILHSRHQYHWHTGYIPPQTVACPHIGSWMARVLGPKNPVIPPFINIGQKLEGHGEQEELKAFTTGGFFGTEFGPFNLPFPDDAGSAVRPPKGMTAERFAQRQKMYKELLKASPVGQMASDHHHESMLKAMDNAQRLLASKERDAFDLAKEPEKSREKYVTGRESKFGGGIKKGFLYGETAPERPLVTVKNPVSIKDLHATIFTAMGISPKASFDVEKRPFYATEDGKGQPVMDLFAKR